MPRNLMSFLRALLCFFGWHKPVKDLVKGSVYEYDEVCLRCKHCQQQLTVFQPK